MRSPRILCNLGVLSDSSRRLDSQAVFSAPGTEGFSNPGPFPKLSAAVWIAPNGTSAVLLLVTPTHDAMVADYDLDPARWYLNCPDGMRGGYAVSTFNKAGGQRDTVDWSARGAVVKVRLTVPGRDVVVVHVECMGDRVIERQQAPAPRPNAKTYAATAAFDKVVTDFMVSKHVAGASVAVTVRGQLAYEQAYGTANVSAGTLVQPHSVFRIASLTKMHTSAAIRWGSDFVWSV